MTDLIIGYGEVGRALEEILKERYEVVIHDPEKGSVAPEGKKYDWMHITVPYTDLFVKTVNAYMKEFRPEHTVIHSTVVVGTTRQCVILETKSGSGLIWKLFKQKSDR